MQEARSDHSLATAVLVEKEGRFYFYQPGMPLIASGDSVTNAYRKFVGVRHDFVEEVERFGFVVNRPPAAGSARGSAGLPGRRGIAVELGLFLAKLCIVLVVVAGLCVAALSALAPQGGISIVDVANKAGEIAKDVQAMPPERKEGLRQSVGVLARELAPVIDAWRNPPPTQSATDPAAPATANKPGR